MVIHNPDRLQKRICEDRTDEADAALFHIYAQGNRDLRDGRHFRQIAPAAIDLLPVFSSRAAPEIGIKGAEFLLDPQERLCVLPHAVNLLPVP